MNKPARINDADRLPWPDTEAEVKWLSDEAAQRVFGQPGTREPGKEHDGTPNLQPLSNKGPA